MAAQPCLLQEARRSVAITCSSCMHTTLVPCAHSYSIWHRDHGR